MKRIDLKSISHSKRILSILEYAKNRSIWGFSGVPIFYVLEFFIKSVIKGAIAVRASSVAFNFFLGLFPAIIFLFSLIPYIPIDNFQSQLMGVLKDVTPEFAYQAIYDTVLDIAINKRASLLSLGFISALYFSTKGINSLIVAFNATTLEMQSRKWLSQQMASVFLLILLVLLLSSAIFLITITGPVLDFLVSKQLMFKGGVYYLIIVSKWIVVFLLFLISISTLYYFAPASKKDWRFFSVGSVFSTLLAIAISVGFAFYVSHFGQYNKLYGSLGTLIVILMWLYLMSFVIILGFELNISVKNAKNSPKKELDSGTL